MSDGGDEEGEDEGEAERALAGSWPLARHPIEGPRLAAQHMDVLRFVNDEVRREVVRLLACVAQFGVSSACGATPRPT